MRDLLPNAAYKISVIAKNVMGNSRPSASSSIFLTLPEGTAIDCVIGWYQHHVTGISHSQLYNACHETSLSQNTYLCAVWSGLSLPVTISSVEPLEYMYVWHPLSDETWNMIGLEPFLILQLCNIWLKRFLLSLLVQCEPKYQSYCTWNSQTSRYLE